MISLTSKLLSWELLKREVNATNNERNDQGRGQSTSTQHQYTVLIAITTMMVALSTFGLGIFE